MDGCRLSVLSESSQDSSGSSCEGKHTPSISPRDFKGSYRPDSRENRHVGVVAVVVGERTGMSVILELLS